MLATAVVHALVGSVFRPARVDVDAGQPTDDAMVEGIEAQPGLLARWHQVVDRHESYRELSCTCMISFAIIRGIRRGWLKPGLKFCNFLSVSVLLVSVADS